MEQSGQFKPWEKRVGLALLVLVALAAAVSFIKPELAKPEGLQREWQALLYGPAVETQQVARDIGPAPTLTKAKPVKVRGKLMAAWQATGAGDASYNGTYAESGTYNGQPAYVNASGRWLYWDVGSSLWDLGPAKQTPPPGPDTAQYTSPDPLPGTWSVAAGAAPAPTIAELTEPVTNWPYSYWWFWDAPSIPPASPLKPCLATIGGVGYVVFGDSLSASARGFIMHRLSDQAWDDAFNSDLLEAYDPYNSGGLFDAGDDANIWLCTGAYLDGTTPKVRWQKWSVAYAGSATLVSQLALTLADLDISNCLETSAGNYRFMLRHGAQVQLCSYVAGEGSYAVVQTWPTVTALPSGYSDVALGTDGQTDHVLFAADGGNRYWMRHCVNGSGQHRIVPYLVTDSDCTQLADVLLVETNDGCQTWGNYTALSRCVGDIGTGGEALAQVDPAGAYWVPGANGTTRAPYPIGRATRRWFLDGTPLRVAGWAADDAFDLRPFVMEIAPIALTNPRAASYGSGLRIAHGLASAYAVDEPPSLVAVSRDCPSSYGQGLAVAQTRPASYATGRAVTNSRAASYGTDLQATAGIPQPVTFEIAWIRGKVGIV